MQIDYDKMIEDFSFFFLYVLKKWLRKPMVLHDVADVHSYVSYILPTGILEKSYEAGSRIV